MLFFDALYGGPIANGFGFLVTLHDSRNPFRGTVARDNLTIVPNIGSDCFIRTVRDRHLLLKLQDTCYCA